MLDDAYICAAALLDILVFARSSPSVDDLLAVFTPHALSVLDADKVEVRRGEAGACAPDALSGSARVYVSCHPVSCGSTPWGELHLTYLDGPLALSEIERGRLLAEVLGAALASAGADVAGAAAAHRNAAALDVGAAYPDPDEMTALVIDSADLLDEMPAATTRARLTLVASRLADVVGSASWFVGVAHEGRLYDVTYDDEWTDPVGGAEAPPGSVRLADYPARRRASEGGAFYADQWSGDDAERCALLSRGHAAVVGSGGYDLDGRSWVVAVFADASARLEHVTAVLTALVQAALCFPREAVVPRPVEPWVRAVFSRPEGLRAELEARGIGAVG